MAASESGIKANHSSSEAESSETAASRFEAKANGFEVQLRDPDCSYSFRIAANDSKRPLGAPVCEIMDFSASIE
jgi:hypothetical protein